MQASDALERSSPAAASLPRPWSAIGRHAMLPGATHDETARFNAIAALNHFMARHLVPVVKRTYEERAAERFRARFGHAPADRHEVRQALEAEPPYRCWSMLRRNTMEMRQQAGRMLVLRQARALAARAAALGRAAHRPLELDPAVQVPRYLTATEPHLMPGGYHTEVFAGDVSAAASYDAGLFATVGGAAGPLDDAAGRALVALLAREHPHLAPRRVLDLGCGVGHNTLPVAAAFPQAEIVAVDVAAPMLRYGHARASALGVRNVRFVQADATRTGLEPAAFDLVFSTMVLHETSRAAVGALLAESHRLLAPGGITVHLEQPPYRGLPPFEQFMRDWDGRFNNEPFWSGLHELDLAHLLAAAGFERASIFETRMRAPGREDDGACEDYGRAPSWYAIGAVKAPRTSGATAC